MLKTFRVAGFELNLLLLLKANSFPCFLLVSEKLALIQEAKPALGPLSHTAGLAWLFQLRIQSGQGHRGCRVETVRSCFQLLALNCLLDIST